MTTTKKNTPNPTGRMRGDDLVLTRTFRAPIEDVWTSITDSASTARWFGPWEGEGGVGKTVRVQMVHENNAPWSTMRIDVCERPRHLAVTSVDGGMEWRMTVTLTQTGDTTVMELAQLGVDKQMIQHAGPGWEYYLDMLVAARAGEPLPSFDTYYPAQQAYYAEQAAATSA